MVREMVSGYDRVYTLPEEVPYGKTVQVKCESQKRTAIRQDTIDTEARTLCKVRHTLDSQVKQVEQKLDLTPASEIKRVARRVARLQD